VNKFVIAGVVGLVWWTVLPGSALAAGPSLTITPASIVVNPGDQFQVAVTLSTGVPSRGLQFGLKWDPRVVQVDRVSPGAFFANWSTDHKAQVSLLPQFAPDNANGRTAVGGIAVLTAEAQKADGLTGNGPALTVRLTAKQGISGQTQLDFYGVVVNGIGNNGAVASQTGVSTAAGAIVVGPPDTPLPPAPAPVAVADNTTGGGYVPNASSAGVAEANVATAVPNVQPTSPPISAQLAEPVATDVPLATPTPRLEAAPTAELATIAPLPSATPLPPAPTSPPAAAAPDVPATQVPQTSGGPAEPAAAATPVAGGLLPLAALATQQAGGSISTLPTSQPAGAAASPAAAGAGALAAQPPAASNAAPASATQTRAETPVVVTPAPSARPPVAATAARPRGSNGLFVPYELLAGVGGGVVAAGITLYALRRRAGSGI
jgi:hypothetical protein